MAKVTIVFEDSPDGNVKVTPTPTYAQLAKIITNDIDRTAAHDYAIVALNKVYSIGKGEEKKEKTKIILPKVIRQ